MTNEQIAAMADWTLEDIQDDPLSAVEHVRELAADYLALQRERDAAVGGPGMGNEECRESLYMQQPVLPICDRVQYMWQ